MIPRSYARKAIRPEMTVRQVAADFPDSQDVFREYGERERPPARFGHLEPLTHFARRQGIAIERLLSELAAATGAPVDHRGRFAERVHHAFLLSALALTLTFGAGWGAWLLWQIGMQGEFSGAPAAYVMVIGSGLLVGGAVVFAVGHRGFVGRRRTTHRDEQGHAPLDFYPPLAFFWLLAALALMTGGVLYEAAAEGPLSEPASAVNGYDGLVSPTLDKKPPPENLWGDFDAPVSFGTSYAVFLAVSGRLLSWRQKRCGGWRATRCESYVYCAGVGEPLRRRPPSPSPRR